MLGILLFLAFSVNCIDTELPFDNDDVDITDESPNTEDFIDSTKTADEQINEPISDEEIKKTESELKTTPTPKPTPVPIPLNELITKVEYGVIGLFIFYVIVFFVGRKIISQKIRAAYQQLSPQLHKYFAIVLENFTEKNYHDHFLYFTGRTGYIGGICEIHFRRRCDILGFLYSFFSGDHDKVAFDLFLQPKYNPIGVLTIAKEKPLEFPDDFKLKLVPLKHRFNCYTDFAKERHGFLDLINKFMNEHPNTLEYLELNDGNRFHYNQYKRWIAHFEFKIVGDFERFFNDELIQFIMTVSDQYASIQFPYEIQSLNERLRAKLRKERNGEKEEKKPLTKEEEAKLEKKREKRENPTFRPQFKKG